MQETSPLQPMASTLLITLHLPKHWSPKTMLPHPLHPLHPLHLPITHELFRVGIFSFSRNIETGKPAWLTSHLPHPRPPTLQDCLAPCTRTRLPVANSPPATSSRNLHSSWRICYSRPSHHRTRRPAS